MQSRPGCSSWQPVTVTVVVVSKRESTAYHIRFVYFAIKWNISSVKT